MKIDLAENLFLDLDYAAYVCEDCKRRENENEFTVMNTWVHSVGKTTVHVLTACRIDFCPICGSKNVRRLTKEEQERLLKVDGLEVDR